MINSIIDPTLEGDDSIEKLLPYPNQQLEVNKNRFFIMVKQIVKMDIL